MSTEATVAGAPGYPLRYDVEYPEELSRWLIFVKWLLAIPHQIILGVLGMASGVIGFIAWFAILFTGRYPQGLHTFVAGVFRWSLRVQAYIFSLTDEYPPFSFD